MNVEVLTVYNDGDKFVELVRTFKIEGVVV